MVDDADALGDGVAIDDQQRGERLAVAACSRARDAVIGQDLAGGGQRVDLIGLAVSAVLATRSFNFDHVDTVGEQKLAESSAVAASTFDPDADGTAELVKPVSERLVAIEARRDGQLAEELSQVVERSSDVFVLMGVHSDCDQRCSLLVFDNDAVEAAGQDCVEQGSGFYEVTAAPVRPATGDVSLLEGTCSQSFSESSRCQPHLST